MRGQMPFGTFLLRKNRRAVMIKSVNLGRELVVKVPNKAGILADMTKVLAEHGLNVEGVAGYVTGSEAQIMIVAEDTLRAKEAMAKAGYKAAKDNEVVVIELQNKPGALKAVTAKLAAEKIDIRYVFGTACAAGCLAKIIFATTANEKAVVALKK